MSAKNHTATRTDSGAGVGGHLGLSMGEAERSKKTKARFGGAREPAVLRRREHNAPHRFDPDANAERPQWSRHGRATARPSGGGKGVSRQVADSPPEAFPTMGAVTSAAKAKWAGHVAEMRRCAKFTCLLRGKRAVAAAVKAAVDAAKPASDRKPELAKRRRSRIAAATAAKKAVAAAAAAKKARSRAAKSARRCKRRREERKRTAEAKAVARTVWTARVAAGVESARQQRLACVLPLEPVLEEEEEQQQQQQQQQQQVTMGAAAAMTAIMSNPSVAATSLAWSAWVEGMADEGVAGEGWAEHIVRMSVPMPGTAEQQSGEERRGRRVKKRPKSAKSVRAVLCYLYATFWCVQCGVCVRVLY